MLDFPAFLIYRRRVRMNPFGMVLTE